MALFDFSNGKEKEKKRISKEIAENENKCKALDARLTELINKIGDLEAEIKVLRPEYESARGTVKNMIAAKIKPLLLQLENMKEKEIQISQTLKDLTSVIHVKEMELLQLDNEDTLDDMEEAIDNKEELIRDIAEQRKVGQRLESKVLEADTSDDEDLFAEREDEDQSFSAQIDSALGIEKNDEKIDFSEI